MKPHLRKCWCIPPQHNAAFVAHMEDILDVYCLPYDPRMPVICMDEQPTQLIQETRIPLPAQPGKPERYDYEYERAGTAVNFLLTEPLGCWRKINVRDHRTSVDWAQEIKELLEVDYSDALTIRLICDNLNTHTIGSFYEAFAPTEARRLIKRLEIHYTPKHGSWLNVAEIELSIFTKQCLQRRIPDRSTLQREASAWSQTRTAIQKGVDWQFTKEDARIQLKSLYPQFQN